MKASFSASVPCSARWSWSPLRPPNDASNGWGPDSLLGGSGAVTPALTLSGPRRPRQFRLRWPGLRQRKQALLAMSSARSASVRGLDPLYVFWLTEPASTSMGTTWFRQLLFWLAGEYWGRNAGIAARWAGVR